jgi:hypothetical protein
MKRLACLLIAFGAAACTATAGGPPQEMSAEAQSRLSEELAGRVAGNPLGCVSQRDLRGNRSAGDALLFEARGNVLYVNRPAAGCPSLGLGRALRTRTPSPQLCRGDIATVFDPVTGLEYGSCGLGEFVPYRKAR